MTLACPCPRLASLEQLWIDGSQTPGKTGAFNKTEHGCENLAVIACAVAADRRPRLSFQLKGYILQTLFFAFGKCLVHS